MSLTSTPRVLPLGLRLIPLVGFCWNVEAKGPSPLPCEQVEILELKKVKEPSGICRHATRNSLFVADDKGVVCELDPDGQILNRKKIRTADFEGITHDPGTGLLYVAIEGEDAILEVDPDTLEPKREFLLPRTFQGKTLMKEGGQGIEAIAFAPQRDHPNGGTFFVANQSNHLKKKPEDISGVFEVNVPLNADPAGPRDAEILRYFLPGVVDLSGLHYDEQRDRLYAISDSEDRMMVYTRAGDLLQSWTLPGDDQEGITLDADGVMYVAQDSGGVLKLKVDWQRMKE